MVQETVGMLQRAILLTSGALLYPCRKKRRLTTRGSQMPTRKSSRQVRLRRVELSPYVLTPVPGQSYEKKAKRNAIDAAEEHNRYINLLNTLGPEISQTK